MADNVFNAEEIKVLTIDGNTYVVSELPDNVQRLVQVYNQWRQEQVEPRVTVMKLDLALRALSVDIVNALRESQEKDNGDDEATESTPTPVE